MTVESMNMIMEAIIRGSLCGICLGFCLLGLIAVWKWFFGVVKKALFYLFPRLTDLKRKNSHHDGEEDKQ